MQIRPATRADSADIGILDDVASSGLASHVLEAGVRDGSYDRPLEYGRDGYAFIDGPNFWKNALSAETAVCGRFRRTGIGRALVRAELERSKGQTSIITDDRNVGALSLAQSFGFIKWTRMPFIANSDHNTASHWVLIMHPATNSGDAKKYAH